VANGIRSNVIAVAHNADDQVETVLLHFLRGSGLSGLRGMTYKTRLMTKQKGQTARDSDIGTDEIDLIRPMLDVTRKEIEDYCAEHALAPRIDETNADTSYLRNRLRHQVIPYLETINPNFREVVRHSATSVRDDYAYIEQNVLGIFDRMTREVEGAFVFDRKWFRALPVNLQRGVLREAVSRLRRLKNIGFKHIENARRIAAEHDAGAESTLPQGLLLVVGYDDFTVGEHVPLPDAPLLLNADTISLQPGSERLLDGTDWSVRVRTDGLPDETNQWRVFLDAAQVRGDLVLRTRRAGERFCPRGMGGKTKSLHEFMIDEKIPRHIREFIPILADDEKVLWIVGHRQDERGEVTSKTEQILCVEFQHSAF
jgi:tRNA(Ile)-lysidine synthase